MFAQKRADVTAFRAMLKLECSEHQSVYGSPTENSTT